jgi:hypothetical protein
LAIAHLLTSIDTQEVPTMGVLNIYRHEPDGSFSWVTSADSMKMARMTIRASAASTSEEFLIRDEQASESITLRADGHWFLKKVDQKWLTRTRPISSSLSLIRK